MFDKDQVKWKVISSNLPKTMEVGSLYLAKELAEYPPLTFAEYLVCEVFIGTKWPKQNTLLNCWLYRVLVTSPVRELCTRYI